MGVLLGQLPLAEMGRLKAELAETLIANFCYPRFYDYRTESLRMRPVDSAKRKEVWLYLSSVDFTAWNRVDVMSPELQTYIERLFIHFVQRNRAFFGNQGRKRMADVRMLITTSAQAVAEGLRAHLANPQKKRSSFGSPRPVPSWATTRATPEPELTWEQISQSTLLLQQQLQELRGEMDGYESRQAGTSLPSAPGRPAMPLPTVSGTVAAGRTPATAEERPAAAASAASASSPPARRAPPIPSRALPGSPPAAAGTSVPPARRSSGKLSQPGPQPTEPPAAQAASSTAPVPVQPRSPVGTPAGGRSAMPAPAEGTPLPANEDVTIFEEMRQQLVLWLRLEAVRLGLDISGQSPSQLIELLRRQDGFEQTRLQVISSLLNLIAQVLRNGKASPMDYKQGLMFFLMHTRQLRP